MVSVLDLMILCLDVDSVEDLPNFGSAEANPADSAIYVLSIPWKSNFYSRGLVKKNLKNIFNILQKIH